MGGITTTTVFDHGDAQAVELPADFVAAGLQVRITPLGSGVLIEPVEPNDKRVADDADDIDAMFARIDALVQGQFMPEGREQPQMPSDEHLFD